MAFDAHIHLYPEEAYTDPASWAAPRGEHYWLSCVAPHKGPVLQAWANLDRLLADMDRAGVEKSIILGWYWENPDTCLENTRWQIEWIARHPDRLIAYAPFNAKGGNSALESLRRAFDNGISGIGELNPPAQGFSYDNPIFEKALELAAECRKPVNVHVTDPLSRDYPGKIETPFDSLRAMAVKHSETTFIFAHLAGMMRLDELRRLPNALVDTAAVPLLYPPEIYRQAIDRIGIDRILFGTDYPLRVFPKRQKDPDFSLHIESIEQSGLAPREVQRILADNFKRLHP